jgi:hypothetical protein
MRLQQTNADGAGKHAGESAASNFRSKESEHGMLDLVTTYWVWIISALIASGPAGYWSIRPQVARSRGVPGWQGWAALACAIGLVVAILLPGQAGLYLDALLCLSFLCITVFLAGAWLQRARSRTHVAAARAAEAARRATEARANEEACRAADAEAAEDARSAADAKAAEDARRAADAKAAEDARRAADAKAAEEARRAEEVKAAEDARRAEDVKAAEDARRAADTKAAEGHPPRRRKTAKSAVPVATPKIAGRARRVAKSKVPKRRAAPAEVKAAEGARSAAATHPGKRPEGMAEPRSQCP